jgi:CRP-like cAMP-binding protein
MEELIQLLKGIAPLSKGLEHHLRFIIRRRQFKKKEYLLKIGQVSQEILFLSKGLVRSYTIVRGRPVSNWFMKEGDLCISVLSFLQQAPAVDFIQALEPCECWGITHSELEDTYRRFVRFNIHGRIITSEYYVRSEQRHHAKVRQTPMDKYKLLMKNDPDLVSRVPNKDLASFLDVGGRTFTTMRQEYAANYEKRDQNSL